MTRERKTPRQRAEESLAAAERAVARLEPLALRARAESNRLHFDLTTAKARRDHLAQSPDLDDPLDEPDGAES